MVSGRQDGRCGRDDGSYWPGLSDDELRDGDGLDRLGIGSSDHQLDAAGAAGAAARESDELRLRTRGRVDQRRLRRTGGRDQFTAASDHLVRGGDWRSRVQLERKLLKDWQRVGGGG